MATAKIRKRGKEIWKSPPSLNRPFFLVSNLGRIRTLDHIEKCSIHGREVKRLRKGKKERKASIDLRGRPMVMFHRRFEGKTITRGYMLRDLVAECFLSGWKEDSFVFNLNGDPSDCRAENLFIGDKKFWGRCQAYRQARNKIIMKFGGEKIGEFFGIGEAARFLGVSKQAVHSALNTGAKCHGCKVYSRELTEEWINNIDVMKEVMQRQIPIDDKLFTDGDVYRIPDAVFG